MKIERIEPTQLPNGLWLDGNEYASENVEESSGVLSLVAGETDGYRVGPELDVGAISDVVSSKLEWTSSGDVEVLAAVSETSAQGSMSFDGVDDYVEVPHSTSYELNKDTAITFWYTWGDTGSFPRILYKGDFRIIQNTTSPRVLRVAIGIGTSGDDIEYRIPGLTATDTFRFVALNFAISNGNTTITVYVNGQYHDEETFTGIASTSNTPLVFSHSGQFAYPDNIFDIRFYDGNLSTQEISALYSGKNVKDNLLGNWPLDDPPGSTTARDLSPNNNDGTIYGASYSPDNPLLQTATNGQAIPGVTPGADLTGKKLYTQQRLSRDTTGDPSPTLTEIKATVEEAGGALPLINGGLIRSAHTQNNTMIR